MCVSLVRNVSVCLLVIFVCTDEVAVLGVYGFGGGFWVNVNVEVSCMLTSNRL